MTAYFLGGFVFLAVLLAVQLRFVLRIWAGMRWTHPSAHAVGVIPARQGSMKIAPLPMSAFCARGNSTEDEVFDANHTKDGKQ